MRARREVLQEVEARPSTFYEGEFRRTYLAGTLRERLQIGGTAEFQSGRFDLFFARISSGFEQLVRAQRGMNGRMTRQEVHLNALQRDVRRVLDEQEARARVERITSRGGRGGFTGFRGRGGWARGRGMRPDEF